MRAVLGTTVAILTRECLRHSWSPELSVLALYSGESWTVPRIMYSHKAEAGQSEAFS